MYRISCFSISILLMMFLNTLAAIPPYQWSRSDGGANDQFAHDIVADSAGNLIIAGIFTGSIDLGGGVLTSAGGIDIYLAKMDPDGNHVWSKRFGDVENQYGQCVAVDDDDNIILASNIYGSANFGGGNLVSLGESEIILAKFDPDGVHLWSQRFGDVNHEEAYGLGTDQDGNLILAGKFRGALDVGGGDMISAGGYDMFLAKLDPMGGHLWSHSFGDTANHSLYDVAIAQDGSIAVVGATGGTVDFGGGPLVGDGFTDVTLTRFDANGALLWAKVYGDASFQFCHRVEVSPAGDYYLCGRTDGAIDFGGGELSGPGENTFLVKLDSSGAHLWSHLFPRPWGYGSDLEVAADGNLYVVGSFTGSTDLGGGMLTSAGLNDALAACFTPAGQHLWSHRYGDADFQYLTGVADDRLGNTVFFGDFMGSLEMGGNVLTATAWELIMAKLGPGPSDVPQSAALHDIRVRAFPNPFNPHVNIEFEIPRAARLTLTVHDVSGRPVRTLADRTYQSGTHAEVWNGRDDNGHQLASGVYFYRLEADGFRKTEKVVLVK